MSDLILIVDDEQDLLDTLSYNLQKSGFETRCALTGSEAVKLSRQEPLPDLVLLDYMLPDIHGTDVCLMIRQYPATTHLPVIMLTARGEESDRIRGLECGADDYVVKPFSIRELTLRIEAILRRKTPPQQETTRTAEFGLLKVDYDRHEASISNLPLALSTLEFRLLTYLLENREKAHSRADLLSNVWDIQVDLKTRTVDVHVKRLRDKLGAAGDYIHTVRGFGYRFIQDPDEVAH
ncbi:MAG: response regulator [Candidatus Polarisedimenticolaceae bacterium]|nr:response regulator [Candidatus Polarisedimenticolaceae bacterium]